MKLKVLAERIPGELLGNPEIEVSRVSTIEEAKAGSLVFVLESKFLALALCSPASAVVVPFSLQSKVSGKPAILVKNPRLAMARIIPLFTAAKKNKTGIHKTAMIGKNVKIGKRVTISPFVCIGEGCEIGEDTVIHPSVTLYDNVKIGKRVIIHAGTRIGVDGYGFVWEKDQFIKIPQVGRVVIEDDVEIFSNVTVARGALGTTRIGRGTKIDCLTHIAHNCDIGENCALVSLIGLSGSVTLKDHVQVGGMVGFNGHITVGENTVIMAKSGVTKDIPANSIVSGFPAQNHMEEMREQAALKILARKKASPKG